jgi:hypothetical protein
MCNYIKLTREKIDQSQKQIVDIGKEVKKLFIELLYKKYIFASINSRNRNTTYNSGYAKCGSH